MPCFSFMRYTPIRHNIMTTCLRLWRFPLCSQNSFFFFFTVGPLGPVYWGWGLHGSDLLQPVLQVLDQIGIWGIWPGQHLGPFIVFLELFLSSVCRVSGHIVLPGWPPLSVTVIVMKGCTWSITMFGRLVSVKWHSHKCQHPRVPSGTPHCDEMINVTHVTCQGFYYCGWSVYAKVYLRLCWRGVMT